jgi:hypothetical protein
MKALITVTLLSCALSAQDSANRITVPFSDASRPRHVVASMMQGCFTVEGYDGKDVLIDPQGARGERAARPVPHNAEGLKRIDPVGMGVSVEEENNTVTIHSSIGRSHDLVLRVPFATSLKLECMNGGDIKVDHVTGDIELQNLNGAVTATGVSGSVIAHSLNGRVLVTLDKVTGDKPLSFSSMNGDVDVTLPADTRGTVRMKTDHGEIYSDFDIKVSATASAPVVEDGRSKGGKYRVRIDGTTVGALNGGGPDLTFKTFNGNIYIRKKK